MIDPGRLNRRLVLEEPADTPDGLGGVTRTFVAAATLWAEVIPTAARGEVVADGAGATLTHRILVRAGPEITTRHRLRLGTRVFRIKSMRAHDRSGRFLAIDAEERVN